jgi:hypothetical protein
MPRHCIDDGAANRPGHTRVRDGVGFPLSRPPTHTRDAEDLVTVETHLIGWTASRDKLYRSLIGGCAGVARLDGRGIGASQ